MQTDNELIERIKWGQWVRKFNWKRIYVDGEVKDVNLA